MESTYTPKLLLTLREAAEQLAVSERTLWSLAKQKAIPSIRVGPRGLRFRFESLQNWILKQEQQPAEQEPAATT